MSLHYLTVQDILWLNLQLMKKVEDFRYADLEEATYYQYGYGASTNLLPQAARFLTGFAKVKPFAAGNDATALIACLAFLKINGVDLAIEDAATWFHQIKSGEHEALDAIEKAAKESHDDHHGLTPDIRATMGEFLVKYENLELETASAA